MPSATIDDAYKLAVSRLLIAFVTAGRISRKQISADWLGSTSTASPTNDMQDSVSFYTGRPATEVVTHIVHDPPTHKAFHLAPCIDKQLCHCADIVPGRAKAGKLRLSRVQLRTKRPWPLFARFKINVAGAIATDTKGRWPSFYQSQRCSAQRREFEQQIRLGILGEQVVLLRQQLFGRGSEQAINPPIPQMALFNEAGHEVELGYEHVEEDVLAPASAVASASHCLPISRASESSTNSPSMN